MPKKRKPVNASQDLAWLGKLPDSGGPWAEGIRSSVRNVELEVTKLRDAKAAKDKEAQELGAQIAAREKILLGYVKRARTEAKSLFPEEAVAAALPTEDKPAPAKGGEQRSPAPAE